MTQTITPSASNPLQPKHSESSADKLRAQAGTIREDVKELGGIARDAAKEGFSDAKTAATDFYEEKKEQASEYQDQLIGYVRHKPVKSILIAAGIGALLGLVVGRR